MASISNTQQIANPGFNPWSSTASLDTSTGEITISVNGGSGRLLYQGDPATVTSQITQNTEYKNDQAFFDSLITTIDGQTASLESQYEALVPAAGSGETTDSTNTEQQNKEYIASGGIDDDSGTTQRFDDGSSIQTFDDGSTLAIDSEGNVSSSPAFNPPVSNAGSTVAGKSGTPVAKNTKPKPGKRLQNPLGNFSSYTYQLSLYMITPDAYAAFIESGRKDIAAFQDVSGTGNGAFLVAQSGGVNNGGVKRAPGFDVDFYIDDLKISQAINGKDTGASTNVTDIAFNITEPYGFSFISRLRQAAVSLSKVSKSKNYKDLENPSRQFFILGIRFQGYDSNGNVMSAKDVVGSNSDPAGNAYGAYERYYDIIIKSLKFNIDGKATVYKITAASTPTGASFGMKRGVVYNGASVKGSTVHDVLMGESPGTIGLLSKLNADQKQLVESKAATIANKYSVKYLGSAETEIKNASIVSQADLDKSKFPMSKAKNTSESNAKQELSSSPDNTSRQITLTSGIPMLQAIDNIIKQSSYLEKALKVVYAATEEPDPDSNSEDEIINKSNRTIKWYNIGAEIKSLGWDPKQGDFAYDITYVIQPYETPVVLSAYADKATKYYGPHKRYEYWFTGKNSEIIKYEQQMDNTFFNVVLGDAGVPGAAQGGSTDVPTIAGLPQGQDKTGKLNTGNEAQNSYMTSLYDPGAYAKAKITILGDPDFLMGTNPVSEAAVYNQFYGVDGYTINPNGGQVFIEINFKEPQDYKNSTGLLSINESILFWKYPASVQKDIDSRGGGVSYMVLSCNSSFSKGSFTQELVANINTFDNASSDDAKSGAGRPSANESQSSAQSNRTAAGSQTSAPTSTDETSANTGFGTVDDSEMGGNSTLPTDTQTPATGPDQQTSPTGGPSPAASSPPPSPPALVLPNPSPTARTTFAGAMIKAYEMGITLVVPVFLPSGKELPNVRGWGPAQWDAQIAIADLRDLAALTSLKENYDTVIQPLITDVQTKIAENDTARKAHNELLANWGKTAGTSSASSSSRAVADDDASGSSTSSTNEGGRE